MKNEEYLRYYENKDLEFSVQEGSFVTFLGEGNKKLLKNFLFDKKSKFKNIIINNSRIDKFVPFQLRKTMTYILNKDIDVFVAQSVEDEIAFALEGLAKKKNEIKEIISKKSREFHLDDMLRKHPDSLGTSDKAKLKILSSIIFEPKILVLDNIFSELDYDDKKRVINLLKEYIDEGNIVLNFTDDVEETLFGDRIIITSEEKLIADGKTISVLNEEKLMKKLGFGLPFLIELNKYLIDYGIIKKYELDMEKLVNKIWK